jgi:acyl-CoA reductase-like NAD-dependent aldehyde dehydrogenase
MTTGGSATARQQSSRAYDDFDRMLVNGHWTHGRSGDVGVDLDLAVRGAVFGKFLHQGQICMAINRLIVDSSIYDDFVDRFKARVRSWKAIHTAWCFRHTYSST